MYELYDKLVHKLLRYLVIFENTIAFHNYGLFKLYTYTLYLFI